MYGANLGGTGLNLIYTEGSPESFGIGVDEEEMSGTRAQRVITVHGAYALVLWEAEGLVARTNITGV